MHKQRSVRFPAVFAGGGRFFPSRRGLRGGRGRRDRPHRRGRRGALATLKRRGSPCGGRLIVPRLDGDAARVSAVVRRAEGDVPGMAATISLVVFLSSPPRRGRPSLKAPRWSACRFYPRLEWRTTQANGKVARRSQRFNPRPSWGGRR